MSSWQAPLRHEKREQINSNGRAGFRLWGQERFKRWRFGADREVPIPVTTQGLNNSQTSVNFKKVQFSLGVVPSVLPDGRIALTVSQTNDDVIGSAQIGGDSVPTIATQYLSTRLELIEGQVAVLGGMRTHSTNDKKSGFPVLGEIPPLSWLFGNREKSGEDGELLIVITAFRVPVGANPVEVRRAEPISKHWKTAGGRKSSKKEQVQ